MSSSTALLPKPGRKDDNPIFLRVCHSAWVSINQRVLMAVRGAITIYMFIVFMMTVYYEFQIAQHEWLIPFEMSNSVYLMQLIYNLIILVWILMHLYFPHRGGAIPSNATRLQKFFSPPYQSPKTKKVFFSLFYTAAMTFPHVVTFLHWVIIVPRKQTAPVDLFGHGWFMKLVILNKFGLNSVIALVENLVLNSVKRQELIWLHVTGLTITAMLYVFWAYIGKLITGRYAYFFFNIQLVGWESFAIAVISLIGLVNTLFAFNYGLTGLREMLTKHSEDTNAGYVRLLV